MKYVKTIWKDLPDTSTPITADKLNNLENGVEYLFENGGGSGSINVNNTKSTSTTDTYSCNYVNNAIQEVYSTEEQVIGTWMGKPLYRKVFDFGALPNYSYKVGPSLSSLSIDKVIKLEGICYNSSGNEFQIPTSGRGYDGKAIELYMNDHNNFAIATYKDLTMFSAYITLEYTKTTD